MKTLYVHVGLPKTGTTSIQYFCAVNRKVLEQKNFCYPDMPFYYANKSHTRNGAFLESLYYDENGVHQPEREKEIVQEGLAMVGELFQRFDNVLLSDEGLWTPAYNKRRKAIWEELRAAGEAGGYQVKIIVYLRRQDQLLESRWNQQIKGGTANGQLKKNTVTWEEYIKDSSKYVRLYTDYDKGLRHIENSLGRENIIVRRFDRKEFYGGSIQADFLHALGLELTDEFSLEEDFQNLNLRLQGNNLEIKRVINGIPTMTVQEATHFQQVLLSCSEKSNEEYPCTMFSPEEAKALLQRYEAGNNRIAEDYFHDGKPLFDMTIRNTVKWERNNPYFDNDVVRFAATSDLQLLREITQLQQEVKSLRQEIKGLKQALKHPIRTVLQKL